MQGTERRRDCSFFPIGVLFRSCIYSVGIGNCSFYCQFTGFIYSSSTETANDTSGQQSFETLTSGYVSQLSPDTSTAYRRVMCCSLICFDFSVIYVKSYQRSR